MKSKVIYTFFGLVCFAIITMSNTVGRATFAGSGGTGAPEEGSCGGCHGGGNYGATITLKMLDQVTSEEVLNYVPGTTYDVVLSIISAGTPSGYGFQAVAVQNSTNLSINTWANNLTPNTQFINTGVRQYFEQSTVTIDNVFEAEWTAPESGSGYITFYYAGVASDALGSTGGDEVVAGSTTITELAVSTSGIDNLGISLNVFPNPTVENLNLTLNVAESNDLVVNIYNQNGQNVLSENIQTRSGENRFNFEVMNYPAGVYFLEITDGQFRTLKRFIKY